MVRRLDKLEQSMNPSGKTMVRLVRQDDRDPDLFHFEDSSGTESEIRELTESVFRPNDVFIWVIRGDYKLNV